MSDPSRIRNPRAIFLDIGGPIYDDENFFIAVLEALNELRAERSEPAIDDRSAREVYDTARERQSGSIRRDFSKRFLGGADGAAELGRRTKRRWVHPPGTLFPDVIPFLEAVRDRATVGVLANQEASVVDSLTRDGVAQFIDVWAVSALVGMEKPSDELFAWALEQAGVGASHAVHIGNRLDTDVRPARRAGMGTVWITRGEAPDHPTPEQLDEPDLAVDSLDGLADRLFP